MALHIENLKRNFLYKNQNLPDPNPNLTPDEVLSLYAAQYPELTTGSIQGPFMKENEVDYQFITNIGTKG